MIKYSLYVYFILQMAQTMFEVNLDVFISSRQNEIFYVHFYWRTPW